MDVAHPDMQRAVSAVPAGFQHAPVMAAMRHLQARYFAPPCPAGQFQHTHMHKTLGVLECHLEWDDGDPETGLDDRVTLCAAYLRGIDIADRLTDREVDAIEIEAQNASAERKRDHIPNEAELMAESIEWRAAA